MNEHFMTFLINTVPEFAEFIKKYDTPALKRINKMIEGEELPTVEIIERLTVKKVRTISMNHTAFSTVDELTLYLNETLAKLHTELSTCPNEIFEELGSFSLRGGSLCVSYTVRESDTSLAKRYNENNRSEALNALIHVVQEAAKAFTNAKPDVITEQRKIGIQLKIAKLQAKLDLLNQQ